MPSTSIRPSTILALVAALAVGFAAIFHFGADANWDLRNYHLYVPYALLEGRLDIDVFPMLQAYLNPALDVPFYLALIHLGIYAAHAVLGLYLGLFIWVVFLFNRRLLGEVLPEGGPALVLGLALAATVIGVTGAAGASQAITTFNEIQTALLVVASLTLVLPDAGGRLPQAGRVALAGVLVGLAVGLKLTAMVYLVGAMVALLAWRLRRADIRGLAVYGGGAAGGILLSHGAWSWVLYERFGNPVFPFFNAIFRSPWESPANFADMRFFPADWWGYLTYPFEWAFSASTAVAELPLRDPRLALLLVAALLLAAVHATVRLGRPVLFVIVFAVVSYVVWLVRFSILRYGVPLEVMAGTLLVLCVALALRARALAPAVGLGLAALGTAGLVAYTHWPDWGRVPLAKGYKVRMQPIPDGATVLLVHVPVSHVVPLMPGGSGLRFVGVNGWSTAPGPRRDAAIAALAEAESNAWALMKRDPGVEALVEDLGWRVDETRCSPVRARMEPARIDLCPILPLASGA